MTSENLPVLRTQPPALKGKRMKFPLTEEDYFEMKDGVRNIRDMLILKLFKATGLRLNEVLSITPAHIERQGQDHVVVVMRSKKKEPVWEPIYLSPDLALELKGYIDLNQLGPTDPLFNMTDRGVREMLYQLGKRTLGRRVSPHELRKLYTKVLLDGGLPVAAAAKMLGHADSRTTEAFYYELSRDQRREIGRRIRV